MPPPEKKQRKEQDIEWEDFDDVPFDVVERAEVYASQAFDNSACEHASERIPNSKAGPPWSNPTLIRGRNDNHAGHLLRSGSTGSIVLNATDSEHGLAHSAKNVPSHLETESYRRAYNLPHTTAKNNESGGCQKQEIERLGRCILTKDGEIKILRSTLKQKDACIVKILQDRSSELQNQTSVSMEKMGDLRREVESLRSQLQFKERELVEVQNNSIVKRQHGPAEATAKKELLPAIYSGSIEVAVFPSSRAFYDDVQRKGHAEPETAAVGGIGVWRRIDARNTGVDNRGTDLVKCLVSSGICELLEADAFSIPAHCLNEKSYASIGVHPKIMMNRGKHAVEHFLTGFARLEDDDSLGHMMDLLLLLVRHICAYTAFLDSLHSCSTITMGDDESNPNHSCHGYDNDIRIGQAITRRAAASLKAVCQLVAFSNQLGKVLLGDKTVACMTPHAHMSQQTVHELGALLLQSTICCADVRFCQDEPGRLSAAVAALQLVLAICESADALGRFHNLIVDGILEACLTSDEPQLVLNSLNVLALFVNEDDCEANILCCSAKDWCMFGALNRICKKSFHELTINIHMQVIKILSCLCSWNTPSAHLTSDVTQCTFNNPIVPALVEMLYSHLIALEAVTNDVCTTAERFLVRQGLHLLHALARIDQQFTIHHATVRHEYVYVLTSATRMEGMGCLDEVILLGYLWDFESEDDADDGRSCQT